MEQVLKRVVLFLLSLFFWQFEGRKTLKSIHTGNRVVDFILHEYFQVNLHKVFKMSALFLNAFEQAQDVGLWTRYTILTNFVSGENISQKIVNYSVTRFLQAKNVPMIFTQNRIWRKAIYFFSLELNKKHIKWKIHKVQLGSSTHYESSEK